MKSFLSFYIPVYKKLLDIKEYVKYFDSKSIGAFYRILCSRVWRLDIEETIEEGYNGEATRVLAREYESGNLVAYISDKELADILCVSDRHIRRMRSNLINLKLIEVKRGDKKEATYFYKLGETIRVKEYGKYNEIFFIDKWLKQVDDFKKKNKKKDVSTEYIPFVQDLIKNLDSTFKDVCEDLELDSGLIEYKSSIFESGHTCPAIRTYMSDTEEKIVVDLFDQDGDIEEIMKSPNNNSINNNYKNNYQEPLFGENDRVSMDDLIYGSSSVSKLGGNLLKAVKEFGYEKVSNYIISTEGNLKNTKTPLADFVMNKFTEFRPESKVVTLIWQWWVALSLDFNRPTLRSDSTRAKIMFSKLPVQDWSEFKYLVNLARTKKSQNFFSMETPTWLYNLLNSFSVKLEEFREQNLGLSSAEINKSVVEVLAAMDKQADEMNNIIKSNMDDKLSDFDFSSFEKDFLED